MELRTQEQPLVAEHRGGTNSRMKRPQPQPPHTRGTFHRRPKPLHTGKHKVSCSGFLAKTSPMQHSCSHYNASCSIRWLIRISLRTWQQSMATIMQPFQCDLQPEILVAEHRGGTNSRMKRPQLSPLPFLTFFFVTTTSQSHHFPSSPPPFLTTSQSHCFPRSPLPFVTTLCHSLLLFCDVLLCDVKSHTALVISYCSLVMYCYVMSSLTPPFINVKSHNLFVRNTEVLLPNFLWSRYFFAILSACVCGNFQHF